MTQILTLEYLFPICSKICKSFYWENFAFSLLCFFQEISSIFPYGETQVNWIFFVLVVPHSLLPPPLTEACLRRDYNPKLFKSNREIFEIRALFLNKKTSSNPPIPASVKFPRADKKNYVGLQKHASLVFFRLCSGLPLWLLTWRFSDDSRNWTQEGWVSIVPLPIR